MSASALIVFREVLEAALVIGIVMAATRGLPRRNLWVVLGILGGVTGAVLVAIFARAVSEAASGMGQELFNATILFIAVAMLGWHNIWMARAGRAMGKEIAAVGQAVLDAEKPMSAIAVVVGIAVLREGSEVVLFLYSIAAAEGTGTATMLTGGLIGLGLGAVAGAAIYFGLVRIAGRYLFMVTSWLILLLSAGLAAQGASFLTQAGYLSPLGSRLWDTSWILSERSPLGTLLHVLVGYTARPDGIQLVFYAATIAIIGGLMILTRRHPTPAAASQAAE